jgi:virulence plasmid B protein
MAGPSVTSTGVFQLSWGAASGVVSSYRIFENGVLHNEIADASAVSTWISQLQGTYTYAAQACNSVGCSAMNAAVTVEVVFPPGVPGTPSVHATTCNTASMADVGPSYTVCWTAAAGTVDSYELGESPDNTNWSTTSVRAATSKTYSSKAYGTYYYRVRACNDAACSAFTAASPTSVVQVITALSSVKDADVIAPSQPIPNQGWVGALPGSPSVEGGAATYRIPIEVAPGRAGMQPEVALTYSSRNGNGLAGVGWAVSAGSSIYRCPRTLAQDGGNRPVQRDYNDRLCMDGQRLVTNVDPSSYGISGTEYRTEVDQFARIRLKNGDDTSWSSLFVVEHKNGRISHYAPFPGSGTPDTWYLVREFDRRGNCMVYNYQDWGNRTYPELVLYDIAYTGSSSSTNQGAPETWQCNVDFVNGRNVTFYYSDRPDNRTTYSYGVPSAMTARLAYVQTSLGGPWVQSPQDIRRYDLSYTMSAVTNRSLLTSVKLCAGGVCGAKQLPATIFSYQQDQPNFSTDTV